MKARTKPMPRPSGNEDKALESRTETGGALLIPTAQQQQTLHKRCSPTTTTRKPRLKPVSSTFYHLPIAHPSQPISINPYISFKATFPTDPNNPSDPATGADSDKRTAFLLNLPRSISADSLVRLFAQALCISPSAIEVSLHDPPHPNKNLLPCTELNFYERHIQIFNSISSNPSHHHEKQKDPKSNPTRNHDQDSKLQETGTKKFFKLFDSELETDETMVSRLWSRSLVRAAFIRFESSEQIVNLMNMSDLPLRWPKKEKKKDEEGWMKSYQTRRRVSRMTIEQGLDYADMWMRASDAGQIPSLPTDEIDRPSINEGDKRGDQESEDGAPWTVVQRGGHHGRSVTIATQPNPAGSVKQRGPDPYAQSSMADRDLHAPVAIMDKKFAQKIHLSGDSTVLSKGSKRKSDQHLNPQFYKSNSSMLSNKRMS